MLQKKIYRKGYYNDKTYKFTHRDPQSGYVYSPDIRVRLDSSHFGYGMWIDPIHVRWC